jgi:chemotaxis signal transduction protein
MSSGESLRYLPLVVSGQDFGIPLSDVITVRRVADSRVREIALGGATQGAPASVPVFDLRRLVGETSQAGPVAYAVVVSAPPGWCVLLADSVRPIRTAEADRQFPLPRLAQGRVRLFQSVVRESDGLILLLDANRLVEALGQVSPERVAGSAYAVE